MTKGTVRDIAESRRRPSLQLDLAELGIRVTDALREENPSAFTRDRREDFINVRAREAVTRAAVRAVPELGSEEAFDQARRLAGAVA
jgi:hypothetical protein